MAENGSTGFAITSIIEESGWEQSCDTGMIEATIIVPKIIELGWNLIQTAKSGGTDTENPLDRVGILATMVQNISFDYHGSWIFEDKHDEICVAGSHDNELYLPPEIRQDRAPTFVCSSISAKPRADELHLTSTRKSKQRDSQQFIHGFEDLPGFEDPPLTTWSSSMFSGFEINK